MNASKIKIGDDYAVMHDSALAMLRVSAVTTKRTGTHSSDFSSTVTGWLVNGDGSRIGESVIHYDSKHVIGPYEEHAALVAQKKAAADVAALERAARLADQAELRELLYRLIEQPMPTKTEEARGSLIRAEYGGGLDITLRAVPMLIAALKRHVVALEQPVA